MAFRYVKKQQGLTLIELVTALSLASIVVLTLFSVLSGTLFSANEVQQYVLISEKLLNFHLMVEKELKRAGFSYNQEDPVTFSDQAQIVYVNPARTELGMVYQIHSSGEQAFRNIVFLYSPGEKKLRLCDKYSSEPLSYEQAKFSSRAAACFSVFDPNQYVVTQFSILHQSLNSPFHTSGITRVTIGLSSVKYPAVQQKIVLSVTQRNWV